jgi:hypothetical protein
MRVCQKGSDPKKLREPRGRLKYALTSHLGYQSVAELEESITANEFSHWEALNAVEPWGPYRLDILTGMIRWSIAMAFCTSEKTPHLKDFIPRWEWVEPKTREQQIEEADSLWESSTDRLFESV